MPLSFTLNSGQRLNVNLTRLISVTVKGPTLELQHWTPYFFNPIITTLSLSTEKEAADIARATEWAALRELPEFASVRLEPSLATEATEVKEMK